jgi:predicted hydrocarbon binding protein
MSARARALREKNVVAKLVKDLNKKMDSFETAVEELKILKESINEMHDEVTEQETQNAARLAQLKAELKDNRTRVLTEAANEAGKTLMSREDLAELKSEVQKWKDECERVREAAQEEVKTKVNDAVEHQIEVLTLQHECKTAELKSANTSYEKEIKNLKEAMDRMGAELESQKQLTANIANSNRPVVESKNRD